MGIADALKATALTHGPACAMAAILAGLDSKDRADLSAVLADPSVTSAHIARALQSLEFQVKGNTVARHRRGECSCGHR